MESLPLCLASPTFFPTHGGAQLRFLRYLPGLRERGIQVEVFTGTPSARRLGQADRNSDWYPLAPGAWLPEELIHDTPVRRVRLPEKADWYRNFHYHRGLWRACGRQRPQVVQLIPPLEGGAIPWLLGLRRRGIRLVFAHTLPHKAAARPIKRHWQHHNLRWLYQCMDHVISNSPGGSEQLAALGVSTPCTVIPNGVDLARFRPPTAGERDELRRRLNLPLDRPLVVTVGAVSARKGSDLLVKAWGHLLESYPRAMLLMIGPRRQPDGSDQEFQRRLDDLLGPLEQSIVFCGERRDVEQLLRAADVFVFASHKEGMPNALLEAMASGLPVVTTDFEGLSDSFGRAGRDYLLVSHAPDALAAELGRCLGSPDLAGSLGQAARAWVQGHLGIDNSLDRYAALYWDLAP